MHGPFLTFLVVSRSALEALTVVVYCMLPCPAPVHAEFACKKDKSLPAVEKRRDGENGPLKMKIMKMHPLEETMSLMV